MQEIIGKEFQLLDSVSDASACIENIIDEIIDLEAFEAIVIIDSRFLHNKKDYSFDNERFVFLSSTEDIVRLKRSIASSCVGSGHMSVLFLFRSDKNVLAKFQEHYAESGIPVHVGHGDSGDPLSKDQKDDFLANIDRLMSLSVSTVLVFSHDAEYLYHLDL